MSVIDMPQSKKLNSSHSKMTNNRATQAKKKTLKAYLILTAIFILIFGGITLLGFFIARLSL